MRELDKRKTLDLISFVLPVRKKIQIDILLTLCNNYMPCLHKFHKELNLQQLDYFPETLIIGTFNPIWPVGNPAQWFYGRTSNNYFGEVLPRLYGEPSLINGTVDDWKAFCRRYLIAITDFIYSIDDAQQGNPQHQTWLGNYSDTNIANNFHQHTPVQITQLLAQYPSIQNIYFTRGAGEAFWSQLWQPITQYAVQNNRSATTLLTPSGYAFYQQGRYNNNNPDNTIPHLGDFILYRWAQQWHPLPQY